MIYRLGLSNGRVLDIHASGYDAALAAAVGTDGRYPDASVTSAKILPDPEPSDVETDEEDADDDEEDE